MDISMQKALELFVKALQKQGKSTNTIVAYRGDINQLIKHLDKDKKDIDVAHVTTDQIKDFKNTLVKQKYTAKSISRKLNSIKNFFSFLKGESLIEVDPSTDVKHPKYQNDLPRVLEPIEYRALRDVCRNDTRATAIVELMLQSGLRIKEIESLKIEDVQADSLLVEAYESHQRRKVPLNNSAKIAINRYIKEDRLDTKTKSVFITKTGRTLLARNIRSLLNRYFKKAGIKKVKVNDLRNTFIAYQLKAGVPIDVVSRIVGHKRISTTEKYLKLIDSKQESKGIKLKEL
jgi:site-specific recombinase XerD